MVYEVAYLTQCLQDVRDVPCCDSIWVPSLMCKVPHYLLTQPSASCKAFLFNWKSLCRALAQEDVDTGPGAIAEAAGQAGQQIYNPGDAASSLYAYLTRKAGMYPDIVEQLVANHLNKGDSMSALITSEWYMRPKHFAGWGRPYEFTAGLYKQLGRLEESRDSVSHPSQMALVLYCMTCAIQPGTEFWP